MTKLIGLKELQQNTKKVREAVAKGTHFIVVYRSKPIFEISPLDDNPEFAEALKSSGLYKKSFIKSMEKAEMDLKEGNLKTYTAEEFLKSLE